MRPRGDIDPDHVDRIVHEAMDRAGPDRQAYLDESCAGQPTLRREVESLLDHVDDADRLFDRSGYDWSTTGHGSSTDADVDESDRLLGPFTGFLVEAGGQGDARQERQGNGHFGFRLLTNDRECCVRGQVFAEQ